MALEKIGLGQKKRESSCKKKRKKRTDLELYNMKRKLYKIFTISVFIELLALATTSRGAKQGDFIVFTFIVSLFSIVIFNTLFFLLLHKTKLANVLSMNQYVIFIICIFCLLFPKITKAILFHFFYNYTYEDIITYNGIYIHQHRFWTDSLALHAYSYIVVLLYFLLKKTRRTINRIHRNDNNF